MKIALSNTNKTPYPIPKGFINGGLWITGILSDYLSEKGYKVDFYTAKDTVTRANKISADLFSYYYNHNKKIECDIRYLEETLIVKLLKNIKTEDYDLINFHNTFPVIAPLTKTITELPVIFTLHDPISDVHKKWAEGQKKNDFFICISEYQKKDAIRSGLKRIYTIYDGIKLKDFDFESSPKQYIAFLARIDKQKGYDDAVKAALKSNVNLRLAGRIKNDESPKILNEFSKLKSKEINYLGSIEHSQSGNFLKNAKALLFPIKWEEPFGLSVIESMACGTPVIAYARGSMPEIIKDGKTGFIVNSSEKDKRGNWIIKKTGIAGLVEAVRRIYSMPEDEYRKMRLNCRKHVEDNFTVEKMVDNYERVYKEVIADWNKERKI